MKLHAVFLLLAASEAQETGSRDQGVQAKQRPVERRQNWGPAPPSQSLQPPGAARCPNARRLYYDSEVLTDSMRDPRFIDECALPNRRYVRDFHTDLNTCLGRFRGQGIEWADGRYYQLTGTHAPFEINATLWLQAARRAGWRVSQTPSVPSIAVIRGNTNGISSHGHVAVVERVFGNGDVCTSNWNYPSPMRRSMHVFQPNDNIRFISKPRASSDGW